LFGMSEFLMFAHEIERARLLARKASKEHHWEERTSPSWEPSRDPQEHKRRRRLVPGRGLQDRRPDHHYTTEDERT
jgi:hypothetical protein